MNLFSLIAINSALSARRESKYVEFKDVFDPREPGHWCEVIKDVVAIANSGGGFILFGVRTDGGPPACDIDPILKLDPATITDKIAKYTGVQFCDFAVSEEQKDGDKIVLMQVSGVGIPMIFVQPGTYATENGRQKTAFGQGTIYFRHGAKSEPGNSDDLRASLLKEVERTRKSWLRNVRKITKAPSDYHAFMVPPYFEETLDPKVPAIRITDDPGAPAYRKTWDESAYESPQEIAVGVLKSWRRDRTSYASESDMWTLYASRTSLVLDAEKAECFLESSINRHAPFFFWAKSLPFAHLCAFVRRVADEGKWPAPNMALKLAHALGGEAGSELIGHFAKNSYFSVQRSAKELSKTVKSKNRFKREYGTRVKAGTGYIDVSKTKREDLERALDEAIAKKDKVTAKCIDAVLYGPQLAKASAAAPKAARLGRGQLDGEQP